MQQTPAIKASNLWQERDITIDFALNFAGSPINKISKDWLLITAGGKDSYNTMTASWGSIGYLWERKVAFVFVRPTRHTFEFIEKYDRFTMSFFDKPTKTKVHKVCGSKSGRDTDKAKEAGITPIYFSDDVISFEESCEIVVCKKVYFDDFKPSNFRDKNIEEMYPLKDYHRIYIGEIEKFYKK